MDSTETPRLRAFAVQHYGQLAQDDSDRPPRADLLRRCLSPDVPPPVRREALLALVRLRDPETITSLPRWLRDGAHVDQRDLLIRCCVEADLRSELTEVRAAAGVDSPVGVRVAVLAALATWNDEDSRPLMVIAATSPEQRIRTAAEVALRRLNGSTMSRN